ncbi:MAG: hypothetical protein V4722_28195 [Bacteroidota bacterium]
MKKYILSSLVVLMIIFLFKFFCSSFFSSGTTGYAGFSKEGDVDYLFIGSSQTRQSLNPQILEDSLGKSYIIAYNGNSFFYIDFIISSILKNSHNVKKIIVEAYPYRAFQKTTLADPRLFNDLNFRDKIEFIKRSGSILTLWDKYDLVMLEGNESISTYPLLNGFNNSLSYKGGYVGKYVSAVDEKKFWSFKPPISDTVTFTGLEEKQLDALMHIISQLEAHHIELVFLEPPVPAQIRLSRIFMLARDSLKQFILQENKPYWDVDDYKFDNRNSLFFHDPVHLSSEGRDDYTKKIIRFVR